MDKFFHPQRSDTQRPGVLFATLLRISGRAFHWLVGFFQLTEKEQREAGVYLDRPYEE